MYKRQEPYTIGFQANWRGDVRPGDVVLVHGAGPIGLIVADVAKSRGAVVIVSEPNENRLAMSARFGADYMVNPVKEDLDALIMDVTGGEGVNVIFEAAGIPALLEHAVGPVSYTHLDVYKRQPKPYHIDKGVARGLFCPGRRAWQEGAADDLDQYAGHKGQIKNNAEKAKCMVKNRQKLIKSLFETAH